MIEPLKPPTDNLYKFIALAGVVIFILSVVYPFRWSMEVDQRRLEVERDIEIAKFETVEKKALEMELNLARRLAEQASRLLRAEITKSEKSGGSTRAINETIDRLKKESSSFEAKARELSEKLSVSGRNTIERTYKLKLWKYYDGYATFLFQVGSIGSTVGFILAVLGFYLWYVKLQRYQDVILKSQIEGQSQVKDEKQSEEVKS